MLSEEYPECGIRGPLAFGGTAVTIHVHVDNADEVIRSAVEAGATIEKEPTDAFYGDNGRRLNDSRIRDWRRRSLSSGCEGNLRAEVHAFEHLQIR